MKRLLDYDPHTGVTEIFHADDTGDWAIETQQDVSAELDAAKYMRNDPYISRDGIRDGTWHYAHIPILVMNMMINEDGVNPLDPNNARKVGQLIDSKYPYLKLTTGKHVFKA
jgi:hypothetical protein